MSRGQMTQALLQTSGFYLGPGFAKNASQGDRTMWLLLALLLFFLPGKLGLGEPGITGSRTVDRRSVLGLSRGNVSAEMGRTYPVTHLYILLYI